MIALLIILFGGAIIFAPWWIAVVVALFIAPYRYGSAVIIIGGAVMDSLYGTSIQALWGFSHIYMLLFVVLALCTYLIHDRVSA